MKTHYLGKMKMGPSIQEGEKWQKHTLCGLPVRPVYGQELDVIEDAAKVNCKKCVRKLAVITPLDRIEIIASQIGELSPEDDAEAQRLLG